MPRLDQQLPAPTRAAWTALPDQPFPPRPGGALRRLLRAVLAAALAGGILAGCADPLPAPPPDAPFMTFNTVYAADGARLPLRSFLPAGPPRAVLIGVHGFNDYSNAFSEAGLHFMRRGVALYAYDQRGFGAAPDRGRWVGPAQLIDDLRLVVTLVRRRHPGVPVYLIGESMGGALLMVAMTQPDPPPVDGVILVSPAVRGRATLTSLQRGVLSAMDAAMPWFTVTGQGIPIIASDNITMLRQLAGDPMVIRHTRIDTLRGLVDLMDAASKAAPRLTAPTLVLAGERDEIITPVPTCLMLADLPPRPPGAWRFMLYPRGYHMLLRDRDADVVLDDLDRWIGDRAAALPSGDERLTDRREDRIAAVEHLPSCGPVSDLLRSHPPFRALKPVP